MEYAVSQSPMLTLAEAARIMRDAVKDKSYQLLPLGDDAAAYLRHKRKRLTESSYRDYEGSLDKFVRYFADLRVGDFQPPIGTRRVDEFMDATYGESAPRTYNKNLSILSDFFKWHQVRGDIQGDPTVGIERAKARQVHRTTFNPDDIRRIIASQDDRRDRLACRLLLDYGLRKGALQAIQFKHFDHYRKRLVIFTKGAKVREVPIPSKPFWHDLERHTIEVGARPDHYLVCRQKFIANKGMHRFPEQPMGGHGLHSWWYRCLANAGVTPAGVESGERMHKARHTAGQRVLDATGNLKAVQRLLGHVSISTTGDVYADWDLDQLATTMERVLMEADE